MLILKLLALLFIAVWNVLGAGKVTPCKGWSYHCKVTVSKIAAVDNGYSCLWVGNIKDEYVQSNPPRTIIFPLLFLVVLV